MAGRRRLFAWFVHLASLAPLALLFWDTWQGRLSANPVQDIELRTGKPALALLTLSLACSPAAWFTGWSALAPFRRILGLYAFLYATLHGLAFVGLDYGFDPTLLPEALFEKRYALAGAAAFAALAPLALTSTAGWRRRLGRGWQRLHRLAYVAGVLAVVHYLWQTKADFTQPALWALAVALLLAARLPPVRSALGRTGVEGIGAANGSRKGGGHASS